MTASGTTRTSTNFLNTSDASAADTENHESKDTTMKGTRFPTEFRSKGLEVLCLVAWSGTAPAKRLELVCLSVCNICRQCCPWSVKVNKNRAGQYNSFAAYVLPPNTGTEIRLSSFGQHSGIAAEEKETSSQATIETGTLGAEDVNLDKASCTETIPGLDNIQIADELAIPVGVDSGIVVDNKGGYSASRIKKHRTIRRVAFLSPDPLSADMRWPATLEALTFGWMFDCRIESSHLPSTLVELDFGGGFNDQVDHLAWPSGLKSLRFGGKFNRPIELATLPAELQSLTFGDNFNQPIEGVVWPPNLQELILGAAFNQPIPPTNLEATMIRKLEFGDGFDQPVYHVRWPSTMEELSFGALFDQPLFITVLPRSLRKLRYSDLLNVSADCMRIRLPPGCVLDIFPAHFQSSLSERDQFVL